MYGVMTGDELKQALRDLGMSQRQLALECARRDGTSKNGWIVCVNRQANDKQPVDGALIWLLELLSIARKMTKATKRSPPHAPPT